MSKLTVIANIHAKSGSTELVRDELLKLIAPTRKEEGCITYELHQDNKDPAHFTFVEMWESRELWQAHMKAPHLAGYMAATEGAIAEFTLSEMSLIG
ncbi:putative quinol monooxygenase [Nitratireductor sp. CH_MIT9313-5]|jgi:quinol monooxygenase YgiN|uniref:putative quinol monooxygenase n=1 Tax=Nitratireductor sp. CH_MIT9313-5 TaxID=3107764 RepID=UPI003008B233